MKRYLLISFLLIAINLFSQNKTSVAERYFGLHFDFHADSTTKDVGKYMNQQEFEKMLADVKPDYLQVDCKGHKGICSYPTKVGIPSINYIKDPMRIWRDATRKFNIPLYIHYSGVWDMACAKKHPAWARIDENGKVDKTGKMSVFGPYVDSLMIPQLKELIDVYQIDGAWIDGDCWAVEPDFSTASLAVFKKNYPNETASVSNLAFLEHNRVGFINYVTHYINAIHSYKPGFKITSNWAHSSQMYEKATLPIDYISGDFAWDANLQGGELESRWFSTSGRPWDLMAWGFAFDWNAWGLKTYKTAWSLKQQAATVLSQGGGFQVYYQQNLDASLNSFFFPTLKEVETFCRERKEYCFQAKSVADVALLFSNSTYKANSDKIYSVSWRMIPFTNCMTMLLDCQQNVDLLMEFDFFEKMNNYKTIVVPEWDKLDSKIITALKEFAKNGGQLLIIGADASNLFSDNQFFESIGPLGDGVMGIQYKAGYFGCKTKLMKVKQAKGTVTFGRLLDRDNQHDTTNIPGALVASYGKGKIGFVFYNMSWSYSGRKSSTERDFLADILNQLVSKPVIKVTGSRYVHISYMIKNNANYLHLINVSGENSNPKVMTSDDIPAIGKINIELNFPKKPSSVMLQPGNRKINFKYQNGILSFSVEQVAIYEIVQIF